MSAFDPFRRTSGHVAFASVSKADRGFVEVHVVGCPIGDWNATPGEVVAWGADRDRALANTEEYQPEPGSEWHLHESGDGLPYDVYVRPVVTR